MNVNDSYNLYRAIKEIVGPSKKSLNIIEDMHGNCLKNKKQQLTRWKDHFNELLNQNAEVNLDELQINLQTTQPVNDLVTSDEPPSIAEIISALGQLKNNKAPGDDLITTELLKGGEEVSINILHSLFTKVWTEKTLPKDWKHSTVVPIHKKGSKRKCDNYRGISLLNVTSKLLSRIIYNRILPLIESCIDDTQCGFRGSRSTIDMIFAARQLVEKTLEQNTSLCIAFVDISKAFDSVNRAALFKILDHIKCPQNILTILKLLHEDTTSSVLADGEYSEPFEIKTGVKQGCVVAPVLFLLYIQAIMNRVKETNEGSVNLVYRSDTNMFNKRGLQSTSKVKSAHVGELMFADDAALVTKTPEELQRLVTAFVNAAKTFGLNVNINKTEVMFVNTLPAIIHINGNPLKEVNSFKYLGSLITNNGDLNCEVRNRINAATQAFARLYNRVWKPHHLSLKTKIQVYNTIVLSTLLYSSECWTLKAYQTQQLNAFHTRCLRTIAGISWKDMVPNEVVYQRTNMLKVDELIRVRRLRWAGHVSRMPPDRITHKVAFSQLTEGCRPQQKPKKRWSDLIKNDLKLLTIDEKDWRIKAADRNLWRTKINENIQKAHDQHIQDASQKREAQHLEEDKFEWKCPLCEFKRQGRKGRQYVNSHLTQTHKDQLPPPNNSLICEQCGHSSKSKAGATSHLRHRHSETVPTSIKPVRLTPVDPNQTSPCLNIATQSTFPPPIDELTCPVCSRQCRSRAGLLSHLRGLCGRRGVQS